jgi:hypothetical protein
VRGGAGEGVQREFERWTQSNPSWRVLGHIPRLKGFDFCSRSRV